ncbi:MAG: hypothetical protein R3B91_16715 [Planctomycetaceae bacterium]
MSVLRSTHVRENAGRRSFALVTAAGVALYAFQSRETYIAILFGFMAYQNYEMLQRRF